MNRLLAVSALLLAVSAAADRAMLDRSHVGRTGGKSSVAPATLRDALELEEILYEREPGFFAEADRGKRAALVGRLLPTLAADKTIPDGMRGRVALLDPAAVTLLVEGTATARDGIARKAMAEGDASPRATARSRMYAAVAQNDIPVLDPNKTADQWFALGSRSTRAPATEEKSAPSSGAFPQERGLFDGAKPKRPTSPF